MAHSVGRPAKYSDSVLKHAEEYLLSCKDEDTTSSVQEMQAHGGSLMRLQKPTVKLPTRGGLAAHLHVSRDTLYEWSRVHKDFSYIMERLGSIQEERLINNGLSGTYNSTIAKVLLTKHGYNDKLETDITTGGEKIDQGGADVKALSDKFDEFFKQQNG